MTYISKDRPKICPQLSRKKDQIEKKTHHGNFYNANQETYISVKKTRRVTVKICSHGNFLFE